jgi:rhodanese-related sulfurtransferase
MSFSTARSQTYAGEITPAEAWQRLAQDPKVRLVDVRTQAEWNFVGQPDLSSLGRRLVRVSWQIFPGMVHNDDFAALLESEGVGRDDPVLLLCRSGVRSLAAAEYLTEIGFRECWNITDGFEGGLDDRSHRGALKGWKASGLPWTQG